MRVAFVYPGQGSQYVGMGKELYEGFEVIRDIYRDASDALGYDVADLCFNGPKDELNKTIRTQPCILTVSFAIHKLFSSRNGIKPFCVAGHSLGEYTALVAADVLSFKDAVRLTEKRGLFMQEAVPEGEGLMAALLGLERDEVEDICRSIIGGYVVPANYNCPGQIVIAGERVAVEEAMELAKERGAKRAVTLSVSIPSHCKLMSPASERLADLLEGIEFKTPKFPIVNNADARFLDEPHAIKDSLVRQLGSPLLWEDSINLMINNGVNTFIEIGPGRILSGLIKRINDGVNVYNIEDMKSFEATLNAMY
ncbi:MAG: ACP S-malonyltransferase [Thermodesulfovibrionia bacterium]